MRDDSLYLNDDRSGNTDNQRTDMQKTLLTIKGNSAKIEGKLIISNSIEIDCEITGELNVDGKLIIQKSGHVNADVKTSDAIINGVYEGNMEATGNVPVSYTHLRAHETVLDLVCRLL